VRSFNLKWNAWVKKFVGGDDIKVSHQWIEPDIFTGVREWSWSEEESTAAEKLLKIQDSTIDSLPKDFYQGTLQFIFRKSTYPFAIHARAKIVLSPENHPQRSGSSPPLRLQRRPRIRTPSLYP
jgi:hypothetical protein